MTKLELHIAKKQYVAINLTIADMIMWMYIPSVFALQKEEDYQMEVTAL